MATILARSQPEATCCGSAGKTPELFDESVERMILSALGAVPAVFAPPGGVHGVLRDLSNELEDIGGGSGAVNALLTRDSALRSLFFELLEDVEKAGIEKPAQTDGGSGGYEAWLTYRTKGCQALGDIVERRCPGFIKQSGRVEPLHDYLFQNSRVDAEVHGRVIRAAALANFAFVQAHLRSGALPLPSTRR